MMHSNVVICATLSLQENRTGKLLTSKAGPPVKIEAVLFDPAKEASTSYVDEVMLQRSNSWLAKQEQVTANSGNSNSPQLPRPNGSDSEGSSKVGTVKMMLR